jgi:D-cysteine desulfhydrase
MLGTVRAGLELAEQVEAGLLPSPDHLFVPYGTGGMAAGLAVGLALGGLRPHIHAIAAVEYPVSSHAVLTARIKNISSYLREGGIVPVEPAPCSIDKRFLGAGYGTASLDSLEAAADLLELQLPGEAIYSGKAWAALQAAAPQLQGQHVLFWLTAHRRGLDADSNWRSTLPKALARRLSRSRGPRSGFSRRRFIGAASALLVAGLIGRRVFGYNHLNSWQGLVLAAWEAEVIVAACEALLPDKPGQPLTPYIRYIQIVENIDRYLYGMPESIHTEIHQLVILLEHGPALRFHFQRLTRLSPSSRKHYIQSLASLPAPASAAYRGIRDLCLLGMWQDPQFWPAIGYDGPSLRRLPTATKGRYQHLLAPAGVQPKGGR